jgi:outer membrane protein assembly factor BamE (lipoprotein component of BamABCDE complex)
MVKLRVVAVIGLAATVGACAVQRAVVANDAQSKMVGMSKEQVLGCMGPPAAKAAEGATEVWSYNSGNNKQVVSTFGSSTTNASVYGNANYASGQATTTGSGFGVATSRYCTVNVTMIDGRVARLNYVGPTGGLLTAGEQCAFAVQNCAQ